MSAERQEDEMKTELPLTLEQRERYLTDAEFHARVHVATGAIWNMAAASPYRYEWLTGDMKGDLIAYGIAVIEALEAFDARPNVAAQA